MLVASPAKKALVVDSDRDHLARGKPEFVCFPTKKGIPWFLHARSDKVCVCVFLGYPFGVQRETTGKPSVGMIPKCCRPSGSSPKCQLAGQNDFVEAPGCCLSSPRTGLYSCGSTPPC